MYNYIIKPKTPKQFNMLPLPDEFLCFLGVFTLGIIFYNDWPLIKKRVTKTTIDAGFKGLELVNRVRYGPKDNKIKIMNAEVRWEEDLSLRNPHTDTPEKSEYYYEDVTDELKEVLQDHFKSVETYPFKDSVNMDVISPNLKSMLISYDPTGDNFYFQDLVKELLFNFGGVSLDLSVEDLPADDVSADVNKENPTEPEAKGEDDPAAPTTSLFSYFYGSTEASEDAKADAEDDVSAEANTDDALAEEYNPLEEMWAKRRNVKLFVEYIYNHQKYKWVCGLDEPVKFPFWKPTDEPSKLRVSKAYVKKDTVHGKVLIDNTHYIKEFAGPNADFYGGTVKLTPHDLFIDETNEEFEMEILDNYNTPHVFRLNDTITLDDDKSKEKFNERLNRFKRRKSSSAASESNTESNDSSESSDTNEVVVVN